MTGVEELAQILRESNKIVFFEGAGMATESGALGFAVRTGYTARGSYGNLLSHLREILNRRGCDLKYGKVSSS